MLKTAPAWTAGGPGLARTGPPDQPGYARYTSSRQLHKLDRTEAVSWAKKNWWICYNLFLKIDEFYLLLKMLISIRNDFQFFLAEPFSGFKNVFCFLYRKIPQFDSKSNIQSVRLKVCVIHYKVVLDWWVKNSSKFTSILSGNFGLKVRIFTWYFVKWMPSMMALQANSANLVSLVNPSTLQKLAQFFSFMWDVQYIK